MPSGPTRFRVISVSGSGPVPGSVLYQVRVPYLVQHLYSECMCAVQYLHKVDPVWSPSTEKQPRVEKPLRRHHPCNTLSNPPADLFHMVRRMHPEWTSPFVFRRQLIRTNLPSSTGTATGVHYDHIFLRDGPPTALTAWVPIGDCSPINGGLMYLEDSVGVGKAIEEEFTRQGEEKGFSKEDATYAFNSNVSVAYVPSRRAEAEQRGLRAVRR